MFGQLRRREPRGDCGFWRRASRRRAADLGRGPVFLRPGRTPGRPGDRCPPGTTAQANFAPGLGWAPRGPGGLHCCFCINMAVAGAPGGPGRGGARAGRPPLISCPQGTAAAAVNMAGAARRGAGLRRAAGGRAAGTPGRAPASAPAPAAWGGRRGGPGAPPRAPARPSVMAARAPLLSRGVRSAPPPGAGGPARCPRSPGRGGVGWGLASGRRRWRGPDRFVRRRRRRPRRPRADQPF